MLANLDPNQLCSSGEIKGGVGVGGGRREWLHSNYLSLQQQRLATCSHSVVEVRLPHTVDSPRRQNKSVYGAKWPPRSVRTAGETIRWLSSRRHDEIIVSPL